MIAHAHGITLGQPMGETAALIEAPGADDTNVTNQTGINTDFRGYAIVPYVSPYRHNTLALNTETLPENADIDQGRQNGDPNARRHRASTL